jgi:xanthine dehydrogenase accessory factor
VRSKPELLARAAQLAADGVPHALATVVSVVRPASTRRGERALVTADGTLDGWVGGACSEHLVVREALAAIADGEPRLVRICPPGAEGELPPDAIVAHSACASEGSVDVLIEPSLPAPLLVVVGESPAGSTLVELARAVGWRVADEIGPAAEAVVVAGMGRGDDDAVAAALATGAGYVGLVASARRAEAVKGALRDRGIAGLEHLRSPAGLDLGPSSQEEIAVAILAELVQWRHRSAPAAPGPVAEDCGGQATLSSRSAAS